MTGETHRADVAVIGGGIAGLVAANRASELGCSVVVLEKGEDSYLCNSRLTGGLFHICFKEVVSAPERLRAAILDEVDDQASRELVDAVAGNGRRVVNWLRGQGVRLMKASPDEAFRWVLAPPRVMTIGTSWKGRGGDVMLRALGERLRMRGGKMLLGVRAVDLTRRSGRLTGVQALRGDVPLNVEAETVILADGGFQGNLEMLGRYITPAPDLVFQRGAATGTGDGIRMAQAAGAAVRDMDSFYGHVLSLDVFGNPDLWPYPIMDRVISAGIAVDGEGRRFVDEGMGGVFQANGIARLPDPSSAIAIFDHAIWNTAGRDFIFPPNPYLVRRGGTVHSAPDLVSLARIARLPAAQLVETVSAYNAAVARCETTALSPPRSAHRYAPMPIVEPPFYAVPLCSGITYTMGGVVIDGAGRVLDTGGNPIPNLFAAGCTTGGIEGGTRAAYVGGLTVSATTALLCAEEIARSLKGVAAVS